MNPAFNGSGEIPLIADDPRVIAFDKLEPWQVDQLISPVGEETISQSNANLMSIDRIVTDWLQSLTDKEWTKIKNQKSLYGVRLPDKWIIVWRTILKEPGLRDSKKAARGGQGLNSYTYIWNIWAEECIEKYLSPMEKDLLDLVLENTDDLPIEYYVDWIRLYQDTETDSQKGEQCCIRF